MRTPGGATPSGGGSGSRSADDVLHHRIAADAIAEVLGAVEAGAVDGHHRHAPALPGRLAHRLDVVADQGRHAGVVDEHRGRMVVVDCLLDRVKQSLFAAAHDDVLLGQVGRHAQTVQRRAGRARAAAVPGAAGASDRSMNDVGDIRDRDQGDLSPVEGAAAGGRPGFRTGAAGLRLLVVLTGRLIEQFSNVFGFHGSFNPC